MRKLPRRCEGLFVDAFVIESKAKNPIKIKRRYPYPLGDKKQQYQSTDVHYRLLWEYVMDA